MVMLFRDQLPLQSSIVATVPSSRLHVPMVNPIVYSLRNKDVQKAVRRLMSHWASAKGSSGPPPPPGSVFFLRTAWASMKDTKH